MRSLAALAALLSCPECEGTLHGDADQLRCQNCEEVYPCWGELPWLFGKAQAYRADWSQRLRYYVQNTESELQRLKIEQKIPDLLPVTLERLRLLIQAKTEQLREISKLLEDLNLPEDPSYSLNEIAGTPLPETMSLLGYYGNVLRDWGWGSKENDSALACLQKVIGTEHLGTMAVLGTGPSRLAYDLHRAYPGTTTIAIDINPFYLHMAARMVAGKTVQLYDFPMAPRDLRSAAVKVRCKAPEALKEGFHFLLADALKPCLRAGVLDTLLTPWLIDIIPEDFRLFAQRMNSQIKLGGRWLNFGSLVFHQPLQSQCYSREEVEAALIEAGFEVERKEEPELPYLLAEHNCQKRYEVIYCFSARKVREVEAPPRMPEHPSWIAQPDEVIPPWPELQQQIIFNHTLAVFLAQVNGERSLNDMSQLLAAEMGMPPDQVLPLLRRVVERSYQMRLRTRSF